MAELGSSAEKGTDSDDDSASGMINYIDRLTNVTKQLHQKQEQTQGI